MSEIKLRPVVGWTIHAVADSAVLLGLQTVGDDAQRRAVMADTATPDSLPALMTPHQCLELAAALTRAADRILAQQTPPESDQS